MKNLRPWKMMLLIVDFSVFNIIVVIGCCIWLRCNFSIGVSLRLLLMVNLEPTRKEFEGMYLLVTN